jgi:hypothetical protein
VSKERGGIVSADVTVRDSARAGEQKKRWVVMPFVVLIRMYQLCLSPWLGTHCRFMPTCSQYAIEALTRRGLLWGSWLTMRRLLRCRPGGGSGYDPVPGMHNHQDCPK